MTAPSVSTSALETIVEDLLPRPLLFPDEDPASYDGLRYALLHDLAPRAPYERLLAENLVTLEWEAMRYRRLRDELIRARVRDLAVGALERGEVGDGYRPSATDKALARGLIGFDPESVAMAQAALQERHVNLGEILAKAYAQVSEQVERHEKKLAEFEVRRRRLREEYDRLRAVRVRVVEDAEIVR